MKLPQLVAEKHKAAEHGQVRHTKKFCATKAVVGGTVDSHSTPCMLQTRTRCRAEWHQQKHCDDHEQGEIDEGQDVLFGKALTQRTCEIRAHHVQQPHQRQGVACHLGRQALVFEV